jgi:exopolysaccharide biosynthesis polyprenyl glycosylphosphotransferase
LTQLIARGVLRIDLAAPATIAGTGSVLIALGCLAATRAWDLGTLGVGAEEFSRVVRALAGSAVLIGLAGLALQEMRVRPWVFGFVPLGTALVLIARFALRKHLHRLRSEGRCLRPVLAVGTSESIADLVYRTRRDRYNGWVITGACTSTGLGPDGGREILGVPILGDLDAVASVARAVHPYAVSVSAAPGWSSKRLHQLAWDLEELGTDLVVDPGLMEIAGPRLHISPLDGLPLLRLTQPTFSGVARIAKHVTDRVGALLLLLLLAPVMVMAAVAVKLDGGPIFYRQTRVGRHGTTFSMIKFRSMCVDADRRRAELAGQNEGSGPLFKLRNDPRITRVGAVIRAYSVDELPQILNVLAGSMSLVGPRPPLPEEVQTYGREANRKLLVKPGLTGLWQVSGRSNLTWEESVRLDLRYVENWSPALDLLILWKTIGAVVRRTGAY